MNPEDNAERLLDAEVATKVMRLPNVGWYRRKSCYDSEWEPCSKDAVTPDFPAWHPSLYYAYEDWPKDFVVTVPRYSTAFDDVALVWQETERQGWSSEIRSAPGRQCSVSLSKDGETCSAEQTTFPKAMCMAALATAKDRKEPMTVGDTLRPAAQEDIEEVQRQLAQTCNNPNMLLVSGIGCFDSDEEYEEWKRTGRRKGDPKAT